MGNSNEQSAVKGQFFPILLTIGGFFLFLVVVLLVWNDRRPQTVAFGGKAPEERREILLEQKAREQEVLNKYGWIDQDQGVVRLPVDRAIDLVLEEMNQEEPQN